MSVRCTPMYICGQVVHGKDRKLVTNPYDNLVVAELCVANEEDVDRAISAAKEAAPKVAALTANQRAEILEACAQKLRERTEEFARAITIETGKPLKNTRQRRHAL